MQPVLALFGNLYLPLLPSPPRAPGRTRLTATQGAAVPQTPTHRHVHGEATATTGMTPRTGMRRLTITAPNSVLRTPASRRVNRHQEVRARVW